MIKYERAISNIRFILNAILFIAILCGSYYLTKITRIGEGYQIIGMLFWVFGLVALIDKFLWGVE